MADGANMGRIAGCGGMFPQDILRRGIGDRKAGKRRGNPQEARGLEFQQPEVLLSHIA
jgi:hypothetical protein